MTRFISRDLSLQEYWRAIILYGENVTSYKFALAKTLLEINPDEGQLIKLDESRRATSFYLPGRAL